MYFRHYNDGWQKEQAGADQEGAAEYWAVPCGCE